MPPRMLPSQISPRPDELARVVSLMAGIVDDPIALVRARWGEYSAGSRKLTLQVVSRDGKPYPPRSFKGYRTAVPKKEDGRWVVGWFIAASEFGTPIDCVSAQTKGMLLRNGSIDGYYETMTDENGQIEVTITKGGTETWVHAGVVAVLRSRGIDWTNAPADPAIDDKGDPVSTTGSGGGGTSGGSVPGSGGGGGSGSSGGGGSVSSPTTFTWL